MSDEGARVNAGDLGAYGGLSRGSRQSLSRPKPGRAGVDLPLTWRPAGVSVWTQAACRQVAQVQSSHTQAVHWSPPQLSHEQTLWLQVAQVQSSQVHCAQLSEQLAHEQVTHSS